MKSSRADRTAAPASGESARNSAACAADKISAAAEIAAPKNLIAFSSRRRLLSGDGAPSKALTRRTVIFGAAIASSLAAAEAEARTLSPGLELLRFDAPARMGDGRLYVLRIDPRRFAFTLLTQRLTGRRLTARDWAARYNLVAATNAAMFAPNGRPVSYCKADNRVVTGRISRDRSVFVFDRENARLIDRTVETFRPADHNNALQGIRMIASNGANVWAQQQRRWSIACLAVDRRGRVLFLHKRSPMSVHDFIAAAQGLPLDLARGMYLEGGPEATLYVKGGGVEIERFGSYETAFNENDDNDRAWPVPNVIGVRPRDG